MEDLNKTLVDIVLDIRKELGMPKFAPGDWAIPAGPGFNIGRVLGYCISIKKIILLEMNAGDIGYEPEYLQHHDWVKEMDIELDPKGNYFWADETNCLLFLKDTDYYG